jgi:hypothetical protein
VYPGELPRRRDCQSRLQVLDALFDVAFLLVCQRPQQQQFHPTVEQFALTATINGTGQGLERLGVMNFLA